MDIMAQASITQTAVPFARARFAPDDGRPASASILANPTAAGLAGRFCAWRGASDRRYIATVVPVDRSRHEAGLPDGDRFVLVAVAKSASRRVLSVRVVERSSDRRGVIAAALAAGADEWHIHPLVENRAAEMIVADLRARHDPAEPAARYA